MEQNFIPGLGSLLQPSPPSTFPVGNGIDSSSLGSEDQLTLKNLLERRGPGLGYIGDGNHSRPMPLPDLRQPRPGLIGGGNFIGIRPPIFGGLQPIQQPAMPDYSSQFEKFGEQLTGFGDQMTGYQDALGSFNEQVGGMGKQFETITNRLDSVDKGLGSLGNQIASLEQAQPQQVMQPQRPAFNQFNPFGFGGLGSLFMRR